MAKLFLMTRPKHDIPTSYLHSFSKGALELVRNTRDIHLINLEGEKATRKNLNNSMKEGSLIFLNGHGNRTCVMGHKDEIILDKKNINLTKNSIVYALACDSLEDLGEAAISENGTKAYIGYKAKFMIIHDPSRVSSPEKDKNALPFRKACFALISSLITGADIKTAISRTKKEYIHSIKSYGTSQDDPFGDAPLIRFALAWNLEFLDFKGNPEAVFSG